jgi:aminopeptidase-like protein
MTLTGLDTPDLRRAAAADAMGLMRALQPICRSITGNGVRQTLELISARAPLQVHEVPTGTAAFDWEVPREWNIREAWIADASGRRVVDFRDSALHVVGYSTPVHAEMPLSELRPHLHTLPEHPDWIPYRTSYYKENWGFCLRHRTLEALRDGQYTVHIDSTLEPGHLTYGECVVPGTVDDEFLIFTHVCHPTLCNDNLTGIAVAAALAAALPASTPYLTHRFVFAPGTIGSLVWLSRHESSLSRVRHGLVLGLLGDRGPLTYKRSRRGSADVDRIAAQTLPRVSPAARLIDFSPYGYDERQLCSPGFNLPVGRLTRSPNNEYPEYHSSADDFSIVSEDALAESLAACAAIIGAAHANATFLNLSPKGEPRLGKRGLFGDTGGMHPGQMEHALLWVLNQSDGSCDLLGIAERSGLPFEAIAVAAAALERAGLLRRQ